MTPLAMKYAKQMLANEASAGHISASLTRFMNAVCCFDMSNVLEMAVSAIEPFAKDIIDGKSIHQQLAFLPASVTWLEWIDQKGLRFAVCLNEISDDSARLEMFYTDYDGCLCGAEIGHLTLAGSVSGFLDFGRYAPKSPREISTALTGLVYAFLAIINTPKIIGRRTNASHKGFASRINRCRGLPGRFPLNAWTEIKLSVATQDETGSPAVEARYVSGKRALHFVRSHLRLWNGTLIFIKSHWRGSSTLGIRRSRYVLEEAK